MADHDQPALVRLEELAQPDDRVGVEVVGGLVEQQRLGAGEQDPGQLDPAALATGEGLQRLGRGSAPRCRGCCAIVRGLGLGGVPAAGVQLGVGARVALHRPLADVRVVAAHLAPRPRAAGVRRRRGRARTGSGRGPAPRGRRCAGPAGGSRPRRWPAPSPTAGSASPARILVRVVLPAPLRPTRPTLSPAATRKLTFSMRSRAPARTSSWWAVIMRLVSLGAAVARHPRHSEGPAMRFNPKARLDTSRMGDAGRGRRGGGPAAAEAAASRSPAAGPAAASAA